MVVEKSRNLIDYIIAHTDLSQADLARKMKVSRAQISKWKGGDYLASDRESQLLKIAGLFDTVCVEWAMFAKSEKNAEAWYTYVLDVFEDVEWGSSLKDLLNDNPDIYVGHIITDLCALEANIEEQAPTTKWVNEEEYELTALASALFSVLETWGQLTDWIDATLNFDDLTDDAEYEIFDPKSDLEWLAFDLALSHVDKCLLTAIGVEEVKLTTLVEESRQKIKSHLHEICQIRTKHGLPITDDYFQLLYLPPEELAEQSWFRPAISNEYVGSNLIKSYLPYGQRLILLHLESSANTLRDLEEKLDRIIQKSSD